MGKTFESELLLDAAEDYLQFVELEWLAQKFVAGASREDVIDFATERIGRLADQGLIELGQVRGSSFLPANGPAMEQVEEVRAAWLSFGRDLQMGDVGWIRLTPEGRRQISDSGQ